MPEIDVEGYGNLVAGRDISNNTINIHIVQGSFPEYDDLLQDREFNEQLLLSNTLNEIIRTKVEDKVAAIQKKIELFTKRLTNAYKKLNAIAVDDEDAQRAKQLLEQGNVAEAQRLLNEEEIESQYQRLKKLIDEKNSEIEDAQQKIRVLAEKFLAKATIALLDYNDPGREEKAEDFLKKSIAKAKYPDNLSSYAHFLSTKQRDKEELEVYKQILDIGDGLEILERARVLNNMAHIYLQYGEIDKATECFLQIKPLVKADDKDVNTIVSGFMGLITFESIILKQLRLSSEVEFTKIEELLNLRRRFMYINPEREIHEVGFIAYAHTLSEIANVLLEKDMYSEGLRYFEEAIQVLLEFHAKCSTYSGYIPKDLILVTTKNLELIAKSPNVLNDRLEKYIDDIVVITDSFVDIIRKSKNERNVKQNLLLRIVLSYYCLGTLSEIHGNDLAKRAFSLIHETEPIQQNVELYCILYSNLLLSGEEDKKYIYDISVTLRSFFPFLHSSDEEIIEIRKSALNYIETYEQGNAYPKKEGQVDENIPS